MYIKILIYILLIRLNLGEEILIPHSHDDLGWINTIEEYYEKKVSKILDNVLTSLEINNGENKRKFVYSEVGFLKMYINRDEKSKSSKISRINELIKKNKFEFINGGMSQSDSAAPFYEDIMENYYYGLSYLKRNFNSNSKSAWQIDPFGHSKCLSYLARLFGMKEIVVNRIGDAKKDNYGKDKNFTFNWNFHDGSTIRTHLTSNHYSSPNGMNCDGDCDIKTFHKQDLDNFLEIKNKLYTFTPWYFFGDDFNFVNAENNFTFIDQVLELYPDFNYGLFSDYIKLVDKQQKEEKTILTNFEEDFFVYEEGNGDSWSGYFTSKQRLKKRIRKLGNMLRTFKRLVILESSINNTFSNLNEYIDIAETFGIFLHHDCITGTAKRYVDEDYFKRMAELEQRMVLELNRLFNKNYMFCFESDYLFNLEKCEFKNNLGNKFILNVINTSILEKNRLIKFVAKKNDYKINSLSDRRLINYGVFTCFEDKCEYFFYDNIISYGSKKYEITINEENNKIKTDQTFIQQNEEDLVNFEDIIKDNKLILKSKQDSKFINEISIEKIEAKSSGAYILKYDNDIRMEVLEIPTNRSVIRTDSMQILKYYNNDWSLIITNEISNPNVYEIKVQVNNVEIFKSGIDLVAKISNPDIKNKFFTTDSNGLFEMKRENGKKFETSVFPFTSDATITDEESNFSTKVLTKNSQGVANPEEGILLIFLERSSSKDDGKGVGELLEVNNAFITSNYVINEQNEPMTELFYSLKKQLDNELLVLYSLEEDQNNEVYSMISLGTDIKLTFDFVDETSFLMRMQNIRRDIPVSFNNNLLRSMFGDKEVKLTSYQNLFYDNNMTLDVENNDVLNPLEFRLYQIFF